MATYYALPSLSTWTTGAASGWSASSGGAAAGTGPTSTDTVIFDANSGAARTISVNAFCASINSTGANNLTLNGSLTISQPASTTANFSGFSSSSNLSLTLSAQSGFSTYSVSLTGGNVVFLSLTNNTSNNNITFLSGFKCNGAFSGSSVTELTFTGFNHSFSSLNLASVFSVNIQDSVISLTGSGNVWVPGVGGAFQTRVTTNSGFRLTDTSSSTKIFNNAKGTTTVDTAINIFVETGLGSGAVLIQGTQTYKNFYCKFGSTLTLPASTTTTVETFAADGNGGIILINSSTSGTAATLAKSGGGTVDVNYCNIKDITASPAATFTARNSKNISNNTGWTFIPPNDRFFQFL